MDIVNVTVEAFFIAIPSLSQQDITPMGLGNLGLQLAGEEKVLDKVIRTVAGMVNT